MVVGASRDSFIVLSEILPDRATTISPDRSTGRVERTA
jgi:hypothetical protein